MSSEVNDFLAHYGVMGMKWGKHNARPDSNSRPKMSRKKKLAIAASVGATIAVGAIVTVAILNNKKTMNTPMPSAVKLPTTDKGKFAVKRSDTYLLDSRRNDLADRLSADKAKKASTNPNILENRLNRAGLSPSDLRSGMRTPTPNKPDLNVLSDIMNGGPHVTYNPKSGRYETK